MDREEIRILLAEDNPIEAELLEQELTQLGSHRFSIFCVELLEEVLERLQQETYTVILLDLGLPDSQGLETFLSVYEAARGAAVVVLSGLDDERLAMKAVRMGAQDYLVKGKSDACALGRALNHAVQRHRLVAELELSKARLKAQYKWIPIPTCTWERMEDDFVLVDLNHAAKRVIGRHISLGMWASEALRDFPDVLADLHRCFEQKTSLHRELTVTLVPEEGPRHLRATYGYAPPNLLMAHVEDMTEQKRAERRLRRSEERFRAIFESAQDSIFIKDLSFRYTHVNPAAERLFGLPASAFIGKTDEELFGAEASAYLKDVDERVLSGEFIEEENTRKLGGIPVTFHEIRVPLRNSEGSITGLCAISRNITGGKVISINGAKLGAADMDWSHTIVFPTDLSLNAITRKMKTALIVEALRRSGGSRQGAARLLGISRYSLKHYMNSLGISADE
jgi:PAS domain S-box-containing protein